MKHVQDVIVCPGSKVYHLSNLPRYAGRMTNCGGFWFGKYRHDHEAMDEWTAQVTRELRPCARCYPDRVEILRTSMRLSDDTVNIDKEVTTTKWR